MSAQPCPGPAPVRITERLLCGLRERPRKQRQADEEGRRKMIRLARRDVMNLGDLKGGQSSELSAGNKGPGVGSSKSRISLSCALGARDQEPRHKWIGPEVRAAGIGAEAAAAEEAAARHQWAGSSSWHGAKEWNSLLQGHHGPLGPPKPPTPTPGFLTYKLGQNRGRGVQKAGSSDGEAVQCPDFSRY